MRRTRMIDTDAYLFLEGSQVSDRNDSSEKSLNIEACRGSVVKILILLDNDNVRGRLSE